MHCGVMVTGYNQDDWDRLMDGDYDRPPRVSDAENMDNTLYMGDLVEPLGFDSIWATEHYGSAYSMQPNPLQYLSYWAGRTNRVDVGTAVIVAPWWNPVRLAHEISMLDILLKGRRLHLGIGRGIAPHEYASLGYPIEESHKYFYDVINTIKAADGAERFSFKGDIYDIPPTSIRPQARHKGDLTKNIKVAFTTEASGRLAAQNGLGQLFVAGDNLDDMTSQVQRFNKIRHELGLPPDQPTTLLWMYCAETEAEAEEGWEYFYNQLTAAQHHYFEWNNPGFDGINGYEEYLKRQTADVGAADAGFAARRDTQPIGTPDQIIERIQAIQDSMSVETVVVHVFYGGMPRDKAEKSLRLFAEKVLPYVQGMATPINPKSLGEYAV
ncbi:MAG: LLM class flavin-dependent oxidoreductase [SAR202 cluster bacterium]|jgi:alkanesulfonate monooxygenase SsuD/methylene tetrahydromethanopterin reductase-like flavin-dependent oxidoreductase (luciferase family)|nr:MAG: LLM class flavin-dependent oxidoreductase [SAR202 cluster bacterium]